MILLGKEGPQFGGGGVVLNFFSITNWPESCTLCGIIIWECKFKFVKIVIPWGRVIPQGKGLNHAFEMKEKFFIPKPEKTYGARCLTYVGENFENL